MRSNWWKWETLEEDTEDSKEFLTFKLTSLQKDEVIVKYWLDDLMQEKFELQKELSWIWDEEKSMFCGSKVVDWWPRLGDGWY